MPVVGDKKILSTNDLTIRQAAMNKCMQNRVCVLYFPWIILCQPSDIKGAQARRIYPIKKKINIWNRLTFPNKHIILEGWKQISGIRRLKEPFDGNSVEISHCRVFTLFETVPGCRTLSHNVNCNLFVELLFKNCEQIKCFHVVKHWSIKYHCFGQMFILITSNLIFGIA